ncbi:FAD:protein FMN transferase [Caproiciproducens sp. NJN-50]|uniref:FAD:protein FMN transferase n=1 Tax=Acutalibacteraceae TaxID=3082771 RepID=UPI000FFDFE32|nr:FAD:protein FMN transferase [Caproiciproducens sp. NJN-50]
MVSLRNQFLSTSGDYEQSFIKDGRRYHHILDKSTGYPADSGLRAVSVIGTNGALCEAYSTACHGAGAGTGFSKRGGRL